MSSNQKSGLFLKECMADALVQLMKTTEFSKITVNEIAETAGVNRSTWFRSFKNKGDALTFKLVQMWLRWVDKHNVNTSPVYTPQNALDFFRFCYENRTLFHNLIEKGLQSVIYEAFFIVMNPQFSSDTSVKYKSCCLTYGLIGVLGEWNRRDFQETPDELAEILQSFFKAQIT